MIKINLLPKTLRKRVEPGWWRIIAVAVPVVTLGVIGAMQVGVAGSIRQAEEQRDQLQAEVNALQRYVSAQQDLERQQKELRAILEINKQLTADVVTWSVDLANFIERLPRTAGGRTGVALSQLSLKRLTADESARNADSGVYDGKYVVSEMALQGKSPSMADIIGFLRVYEQQPGFGVQFSQAARDQQTTAYTFSASVGVVGTRPPAPPADAATTGSANGK